MPRLVFQDPGEEREICLRPGLNRVGRDEANDHLIDDPSVSRFHCEIMVTDSGARIRDLNSANGTFLDSLTIQETDLRPGQSLRLGAVRFIFEPPDPLADPPRPRPISLRAPSPEIAIPESAIPASSPEDCARHPGTPASLRCRKCQTLFCSACAKSLRVGLKNVPACPVCGGLCAQVGESLNPPPPRKTSFYTLLPGAFRFPFKENGPVILFIGAVGITLANWAFQIAVYAMIFGFTALLILTVASIGYLYSFMRGIMVSAANGEETMPPWPDITGFWDDLVVPFFQFLAIWAVCLGPGIFTMVQVSPILGSGVLLAGVFCLPMALLTVGLADSIGGLNPVIIFSSITKAPGAYLTACAIFLAFLAARSASELILVHFPLRMLPTFLLNLIGLYGLVVEMRIMGLFYFVYKKRLAWFNA